MYSVVTSLSSGRSSFGIVSYRLSSLSATGSLMPKNLSLMFWSASGSSGSVGFSCLFIRHTHHHTMWPYMTCGSDWRWQIRCWTFRLDSWFLRVSSQSSHFHYILWRSVTVKIPRWNSVEGCWLFHWQSCGIFADNSVKKCDTNNETGIGNIRSSHSNDFTANSPWPMQLISVLFNTLEAWHYWTQERWQKPYQHSVMPQNN